MQICRELLPEMNVAVATANTKMNLDIETIVCQLYQKYFASKVLQGTTNSGNCGDVSNLCAMLEMTTNQSTRNIPQTIDDVWIFGYGSLVWKADFPFIDRRKGFIRGYQRRFYQHSIDHRGTYERPGRVVTLLPTAQPEDRVYGVAYRIAAQQKGEVLAHLDYREKNGYQRCTLEFQEFPEETGKRCDIIMYIATPENESYAGAVWQLDSIAEQIFTSAGPSGPNREYLFNLANTMRTLFPGVDDKHLFDLEAAVRRRINADEAQMLEQALKRTIRHILDKAVQESDTSIDVTSVNLFKQLLDKCEKPGWREAFLMLS